jgi:hypothetical protein
MGEPTKFQCPVDGCTHEMRARETGYIDDQVETFDELYVTAYRCEAGHLSWVYVEEED